MSVTSTSGAALSADKRVLNRQVTAGLRPGLHADRDHITEPLAGGVGHPLARTPHSGPFNFDPSSSSTT